MNPKIEKLINDLNLTAHPEGGYYSETYRSEIFLDGNRSIMTSIYFLLPSNHVSKFHRIKSDELWFFHFGSSLIVHSIMDGKHQEFKLGNNFEKGESPQYLVKGGTIFGSSVLEENSYALVSCVVAPGFNFEDFELFDYEQLHKEYPELKEIIKKLT